MLALALYAGALRAQPPSDVAPPHGFVEPCTVAFVQDSRTECELCSASRQHPQLCAEKFAPLGYQRKCRTSGHSAPGEVWCIAKRSKSLTPLVRYALALVLALGTVVLLVFLIKKRRVRRPDRT